MASEDDFEWVDKSTLEAATSDELIDHILALQAHVKDLDHELQGLQKMVFLLLDLQAGVATETHPELVALIEEETDSQIRKQNP